MDEDLLSLLLVVRDASDWRAATSPGQVALRHLVALVQSGEARDFEYGAEALGALCGALHSVALAPVAAAAAGLLPSAGAAPADVRRLMCFVFNGIVALPEVSPAAGAAAMPDVALRELVTALAAAQPSEVVQLRTLLHWVYTYDERRRPVVRRLLGETLAAFLVGAALVVAHGQQLTSSWWSQHAPTNMPGIGSILEVLACIIRGFRVPLSASARGLLDGSLLPLHAVNAMVTDTMPVLQVYHDQVI